MTIKRKLYLSSFVTTLLVFTLIILVLLTSFRIADQRRRVDLIKTVASVADQLKLKTHEYLLQGSPQTKQQWLADYAYILDVLTIIKKIEKDDAYATQISFIEKESAGLDILFTEITAEHELHVDNPLLPEKINKLLVKLQGIVRDTSYLTRISNNRMDGAQKIGDSLILTLSIFLSYTAIITALFVVHHITSSLQKLREGATIIGKGNLDYNIDMNRDDELGELAGVFNTMRTRLKQSYEGIEEEVKLKTKELDKKVHELQKAKSATTKLLVEVKQGKELAEEQRARAETMLQSIGDGVLVVDKDEKIILMNPAAEKLTGAKIINSIGRKVEEIFRTLDEKTRQPIDSPVKLVFQKGKMVEFRKDVLLAKQNNQEIAIADSGAPIKDAKGKISGAILVFRDITKEREIDRMKTEFVSVASHQLRTPLTGIKWILEMLLGGDAGKITSEQKDFLHQAFESNERMISLVNGLLNVSRIETGSIGVEPEDTDIPNLLKGIVEEFAPITAASNKNLQIIKTKLKTPTIKTDPKLVRQVLTNIISNAIKYTPARGEIYCCINETAEDLEIAVQDTGIGIPKEQQFKMFQKFFRANNAVAKETEGNGLGMYIAKSIAETLGGTIWFESPPKKLIAGLKKQTSATGTLFFVSLPKKGVKTKLGSKQLIDTAS